MTSQPGKHSPVPRRFVLGTVLGGAAAAALPWAAHAEQPVQAAQSAGVGPVAGGGNAPGDSATP